MTVYKRTRYTENTIKSILQKKKNKIELLILMDKPWTEEEEKLQNLLENWNVFDWEVKVYKQKDDWCINWLWNKIPELATNNVVFVINDDIEVSPDFDEILERITYNNVINPYYFMPYQWGQCWKEKCIAWHAWAMTKEDLKKILPIDKRIKLRFWDDWIRWRAQEEWMNIEWTNQIEVFHYTSKTCENPSIVEQVREMQRIDIENFKTTLKERGWEDARFPNEEFNKTSWSSEK